MAGGIARVGGNHITEFHGFMDDMAIKKGMKIHFYSGS
jgi:hypothetical protein